MIVFTGGGSMATAFSALFEAKIISFRRLSPTELEEAVRGADTIIHNAANLSPSNHEEAVNDNFVLTKNIVDAILRIKPSVKFIYIGSMSVLRDESHYKNEEQMTAYALSKFMGERYTLLQNNPAFKIVRFSTIFYENAQKDGLSKLTAEAVRNKEITLINKGKALRDFIPLSVAMEYLHRIAVLPLKNSVFTIASGKATSFKEVSDMLKNNIPDLVVNDLVAPEGEPVLHSFSRADLIEAGLIDFDISVFIQEFANKIRL